MFWVYANCSCNRNGEWSRHPNFPVYVIIQAPTFTKANERITSIVGAENISDSRAVRHTHFMLYRSEWANDGTDIPSVDGALLTTGVNFFDSYVVYYEDGTVVRSKVR